MSGAEEAEISLSRKASQEEEKILHASRNFVGGEASKELSSNIEDCREEALRRMYQHHYVDQVLADLMFERARKVRGLVDKRTGR